MLALAAFACGGDGAAELSEADQVIADALTSDLNSQGVFLADENTCLGERMVQDLGAERLRALGVTDKGVLLDSDGQTLGNTMDKFVPECVDLRAALLRQAGENEQAVCAIGELSDDDLFTSYQFGAGRDISDDQRNSLAESMAAASQECAPAG